MIYLDKLSTNPLHNIAAEEVALRNYADDILMLWINEPSVIIGKHQNPFVEVNHQFVIKNNIPVLRRISGGGTVYHDTGNLNYTIITTVENREKLIDFKKFAEPIIKFLELYGIHATFYGKTNLGVNGKKISGNAAHVFKNRVIHHGTLLFNTNIVDLEKSIGPNKTTIHDKSIKSVRADIMNLSTMLPEIRSITDFKKQLKDYLFRFFNISRSSIFSTTELMKIKTLVNEKYNTSNWNYGYSPAYKFHKIVNFKGKPMEISMEVKKGNILAMQFLSDNIPESVINLIKAKIINSSHNPNTVKILVESISSEIKTIGLNKSTLINLFI